MALNDMFRTPSAAAVAVKACLAASAETQISLTGADSGGHPLVPCRQITIQGRAGTAAIKVAMQSGEIAANRYYSCAPGGTVTIPTLAGDAQVWVNVSVDQTVEVSAW